MEERDWEAEARADGWVPEDEWKGDPDKHVDAETFVKRGEEILPIVNAKNRKLSEQVESLSARVDQLLQSNAQLNELSQKTIQRERREREKLIKELEAARAQAVKDGDGDAFEETDRQLMELRTQPERPDDVDPKVMASLESWHKENPWFGTDEALTALADGFSDRVAREMPHLKGTGGPFMEELKNRAKRAWPEKFANPNRDREEVETPRPKKGNGKGRTFADLPDDAKEAFKRFAKDVPGMTEEQYLAHYDWEAE